MSRYDKSGDYDFDVAGAMKRRQAPPPKHDPIEDMLRLASGLAPAAGMAIGAGVGSMAGGIGALPGAAVGAGIGTGLGGAANYGADVLGRDDEEAARRKAEEDEERAAQHRMALSMLGGL